MEHRQAMMGLTLSALHGLLKLPEDVHIAAASCGIEDRHIMLLLTGDRMPVVAEACKMSEITAEYKTVAMETKNFVQFSHEAPTWRAGATDRDGSEHGHEGGTYVR